MSIILIPGLLLGVVMQMLVDRMACKHPQIGEWWFGSWMAVCVVLSALSFAQGQPGMGAWMAFLAICDGYFWWEYRKRRKRKRAPRVFGAKSRALIAKLIARQREAGARA